ncbi:MAG TPA: protein kinase [Patescibacteria group bacterium]|nr:protein kinase [Patescibacteria group bacterium]
MITTRVLGGRYRLLETIGEGGMAIVHRAHDDLLDREVAVKVLRPAFATDPEFVRRFQREARHAAALHDPRIVSIHDLGLDPASGADYIVMQLVDGPDLQTQLARDGRPSLGQAVRIGIEAAHALQVAHDHGIVHRDVKPGNILIDRDGQVRVADFGIARAAGDGGATTAGVVIGSPQYVSPEQVAGDDVTPASDIYSLGVVVYELLTGRRPFEGPSAAVVALQRLREDPAPPSALDPELPEELDEIVLRAMARDPAARFPSAAEFGTALEGFRLRELGGVRRTGSSVRGDAFAASDALAAPTAGADDLVGQASVNRRTASGPVAASTGIIDHSAVAPGSRSARTGPRRARARDDERRRRPPVAIALPVLAFGLVAALGAGWLVTSRAGPTAAASVSPSAAAGVAVASPTLRIDPSLSPSMPSPSPMATQMVTSQPTGRPTPRPTVAPTRPTALPGPGATAPARDPAETVARFYGLVAAHRFDEAASLWSNRMRREYPPAGNIDGRFARTTRIDIQALNIRSQSLIQRSAVVYVDLIEYRESEAPRRFRGTWDLVLTTSGWLMDEPHF